MLSLVTRIMSGIQESRSLRYQAEATRLQGEAARNRAYAQASLIDDSARRNALIDADNLMVARANQREAVAAEKNKRATSGFTSQGTGDAPIRNAKEELNREIENMALSSSINSLNAVQSAMDTRNQGELTYRTKSIEASALRSQAKGVQRATFTNALVGATTAIIGGMKGYNAAEETNAGLKKMLDNKQISQEQYDDALLSPMLSAFGSAGYWGSSGFDAAAAFNPYTTSMTRKNPWGNFYSLVNGKNPGISRNRNNNVYSL